MGLTIAQKLIKAHLVEGEMKVGTEIGLRIDQTLTQDATGTMAYLEFEAMGVDRVKTEKSVAYIDHNTLQTGFENADDHRYIQSVTKKHGIYFSRPGNGICHQVHLERFGIPGKTLIGSDSHTPTGGGIGMLAMGAGGLDVAVAMGGGTYYIPMPKMTRINLTGYLKPWVSAKDVILEVLRIMSVKGGVGKIIEYGGEGVKTLSVPERATITNMGAELGATTSIFPSDEITLAFLKAQGRENDWTEILPDEDAEYDEVIDIDLCSLTPMAACDPSIKTDNGKKYIDGLAYVRQIDFDGDGNEELGMVYRTYKSLSKYDEFSGDYIYYDKPQYSLDIYKWDGSSAKRILNKECVSVYFDDDTVFYLLLKKGKKTTNLCTNNYDMENKYSFTANSREYKLKKGAFTPVYSAKEVNDYGYKSFYINDERVYSREWEQNGYNIPLFLNDEDSVNSSKYDLFYFSGKNSSEFEQTLNDTVDEIQKLNKEYVPDNND